MTAPHCPISCGATGLEKRGDLPALLKSKQQLCGREAFEGTPGRWRWNARFEGTQEIPNTVDRLKANRQEISGTGARGWCREDARC